jgi:ABC transporter substrate binding protein
MSQGARTVIARRDVVLGLAAAVAVPRPVGAQAPGRTPHISVYTANHGFKDTIVAVLRERGWVEGRNISLEWHAAEGAEVHVREHLAKTPVDVFVMGGPPRIPAAMRATTTVPIIGLDLESDPVANAFVKTLARPGGNVSGVWMDLSEIAGKQVQFLREVLPTLRQGRRPAGGAAVEVHADRQPQDREGPGPHAAAVAGSSGGRGDPVSPLERAR